jgi:NADH:ubiquinone oxidoreductase subunit 5 (subunit L)/multisubunit Na+/H+ antiporter MnhA subunit
MPWVAWLALVGTLAMAGLPPLNGFVSEWLLLQGYLYTPSLPHAIVNMLVPLGAAAFALTVALSAYVMVKFYGVVFLGRPRETGLAKAHDAGWLERFGLGWLALGCIALGLMPVTVLNGLDAVNRSLLGVALGEQAAHWWLLAPVAANRASYSALAFAAGIALAFALTFLAVRWMYHGRIRRSDPWDCGFPAQTSRMQREVPSPFDAAPRYALSLGDRWWYVLYLPIAAGVQWLARLVGYLQQGRIAIYLLYSFVTLLALLVFVF